MLNGVSFLVNSWFRHNRKGFYIALWLVTKNRSTTIIPSAENHEECLDMPPRRRLDRIFTVPRLCFAFGGTSSMWCIMSCSNRVKPSQGIGIERNQWVWVEHWRRNDNSYKRDTTKLSSSMTMFGYMSEISQDTLGNVEIGGLTPPTVVSKRCPFRIPFVLINGIRPGLLAFPLLWRSLKIDRFADRLKRHIVFSRWYRTIGRKMKKSSG